jgi:hypothetical protein
VQCFGDGEAVVAGAFGHRFVDGLAGRGEDENFFACAVRGRA